MPVDTNNITDYDQLSIPNTQPWIVIKKVPLFYFNNIEKRLLISIAEGAEEDFSLEELRILHSAKINDCFEIRHALTKIFENRGIGSIDDSHKNIEKDDPYSKVSLAIKEARRKFHSDPEKLATYIIDTCLTYIPDRDNAGVAIRNFLKKEGVADPRGSIPTVKAFVKKSSPASDKLYMPSCLINGILPQKDLANETLWSRKDGDRIITITSGVKFDPQKQTMTHCGLPFGKAARLILLDIVSQAKIKKSRTIFAADTVHAMIKSLGMSWGGGAADRVREQVARLFSARITIHDTANANQDTSAEIRIAERKHLLWEPGHSETMEKESFIRLSAEFYEELTSRSTPLDNYTAKKLLTKSKDSGFDFDLYSILTKKCYRPKNVPMVGTTVLKWSDLANQLGVSFSRERDFRKRCHNAIEKITTDDCWSKAKTFLETDDTGIKIHWFKNAGPHVASYNR